MVAEPIKVKLVGYGTMSSFAPAYYPLVRVTKTLVVVRINSRANWRFRRKDGHLAGGRDPWSGWKLAPEEFERYEFGKKV